MPVSPVVPLMSLFCSSTPPPHPHTHCIWLLVSFVSWPVVVPESCFMTGGLYSAVVSYFVKRPSPEVCRLVLVRLGLCIVGRHLQLTCFPHGIIPGDRALTCVTSDVSLVIRSRWWPSAFISVWPLFFLFLISKYLRWDLWDWANILFLLKLSHMHFTICINSFVVPWQMISLRGLQQQESHTLGDQKSGIQASAGFVPSEVPEGESVPCLSPSFGGSWQSLVFLAS